MAGKGKPVVTVLLSGRPLWVNDLMNLSDAFVAAWLPGTEGKGVSDVLFRTKAGKVNHDFHGTLSFSWPKSVCQSPLNVGDKNYDPLFKYGYGLRYENKTTVLVLDASYPAGGCGVTNSLPVYSQVDRSTYPLHVQSGGQDVALGLDLNAVFRLPTLTVDTAQVNTQQDAKRLSWAGPAKLLAQASQALPLPSFASKDGALQFDVIVAAAPQGRVGVGMEGVELDASAVFQRLAGKGKQKVTIPLACFAARGLSTAALAVPFSVSSDAPLTASFANVEIVGGAARDKSALDCGEFK